MLGYCPRYYEASRVFRAYLQAVGAELDLLAQGVGEVLAQLFAATATSWGLDIWEQELGLTSYAGKPDEHRRSRVISKLRGYGTVTVSLIKTVAESYVYGTVEVEEQPESYTFVVRFIDPRGIPPNLADLQAAIEDLKPAHLAVQYQFTYTVWGDLLTWGTAWSDVAGLTWEQLKTWKP